MEPTRDFMDGPDIVWRHERPDYEAINRKYMAERTRQHADGSLEKTVENLVKTWEMESSHKMDEKVKVRSHQTGMPMRLQNQSARCRTSPNYA